MAFTILPSWPPEPELAAKEGHSTVTYLQKLCPQLGLRAQNPWPLAQKDKCIGVSELHLNPEVPVLGTRKSGCREPVRVLVQTWASIYHLQQKGQQHQGLA